MNSKYNKWLKGGLLGALAIFGMTACEDDHFDIKSTTATSTLWENIESNGQLKNFAEILKNVPVTRSEENQKSGLKYSELLNSDQTFTVWAPVDGSYNADSILDLIAAGRAYDVEKEFVRNHMTRFNYPGTTPEILDILLMNTKKCDFVVGANSTFKDCSLLSVADLKPSKNGTLHLIESPASYAANLYEKLRTLMDGDTLSLLSQYILENDTVYFLSGASTPGGTYGGKVHYVDSVFYRGSKLGFGSINYMNNEDSLFLAAYLSNNAWQEAIDRVSPYFVYRDFNGTMGYPYWESDAVKPRFQKLDADSMADYMTKRTIMNSMCISLNSQPGFDPASATAASVKRFVEQEADSLIFMSGEVMQRDAFNDVFAGAEIYEASNGFYYVLNNYRFIANKTWQLPQTIEAENTFYNLEDYGSSSARVTTYSVTSLNRTDSIVGSVSNGSVARFQGTGNRTNIVFKLRNLLRGRYKISIVMAPEHIVPLYSLHPESPLPCRFKATLVKDYYPNDANAAEIAEPSTEYFVTDVTKMDTITLYDNVSIPYSYSGVNNGYLKLKLEGFAGTGAAARKYNNALYIDCILIEGLGNDDDE